VWAPHTPPVVQKYFACGGNASETADFFSTNLDNWCDWTEEGIISDTIKNAMSYSLPTFVSADECGTAVGRFDDQQSIFNETSALSGAFIEPSEFFSYGADADFPDPWEFQSTGTPVPAPAYFSLSSVWRTLTPSGIKVSDYSPSLTASPCPAATLGIWDINGNIALPSLGEIFNPDVANSMEGGVPTAISGGTSLREKVALWERLIFMGLVAAFVV
jgi:hypothetical protein